jgi:hypothetical protein
MRLQQVGDDRERGRRDQRVHGDLLGIRCYRSNPACLNVQAPDRRLGPHRAALVSDRRRKALRQRREAAAEVGQLFLALFAAAATAELELVPDPDRRDVLGDGAEFAPQQRLPDDLVDTLAAELAQPVRGGALFQGLESL